MYGKVYGRFFLEQYLGVLGDDTPDTTTLSELIETWETWPDFIDKARKEFKTVQLFTMFETDDVHPDIITNMKKFCKVIVPFSYLKDILVKHGVNAVSLDFWSSKLIRSSPDIKCKTVNPEQLIFLYNGTNDVRKNVQTLANVFTRASEGTKHLLIIKTDKSDGLLENDNIKVITERLNLSKLTSLFNMCDYCITCTRGEGVSLLHLEGAYFGKPIISHDQGVFTDIKKYINTPLISLPSQRVPCSHENVPSYLHKVFHGHWWDVDTEAAVKVLKTIMNIPEQVAIITGHKGQDGQYLQEFLKDKGYHVHCIDGDVREYSRVKASIQLFRTAKRIEIYNLAAVSSPRDCKMTPRNALEVNTFSLLNIIEAVKNLSLTHKTRVFQASSSEIFAKTSEVPQDENTPYHPRSIYGISKLTTTWLARHYREDESVYVSTGILYNHESPLRPDHFITQKIIKALKNGKVCTLGNIENRRDWGHAKDYVEAMWITLQQKQSDDYVVATGVSHSIKEFIEIAVEKMGKKIIWSGKGKNGVGCIDGEEVIRVSQEFWEPETDVNLRGNPSKLEALGWKRKYNLHSIIEEMLHPPSN